MNYQNFLKTKKIINSSSGFDISIDDLNPMLFDFQKSIVKWSLNLGRSAIFADCGLGKTPMQLEWAKHIHAHTGKDILILAPLAVSKQTQREGVKFGVDVNICRTQEDVISGINITNYEMLDHFNPLRFVGIVLDESSILKNFTGKIKKKILATFERTDYKLACTATPAPNDHLEIGNHAEFLNIMPSNEMIARWFINDTRHFGNYRLKGHAVKSFWEWVSSWAVCFGKPSEIGFDDNGFLIPKLNIEKHVIEGNIFKDSGDKLFRIPEMSATNMHKELKITAPYRAKRVADLIENNPDEQWLIWCHTNYEADELKKVIPSATEVRGSDKDTVKEDRLLGFVGGDYQILITKPKIAGLGMNIQNCHNIAFIGLSYSYESFYQAVRRCWRYGQKSDVNAHIVMSTNETALYDAIMTKGEKYSQMIDNMKSNVKTDLNIQDKVSLTTRNDFNVIHSDQYKIYNGDSCLSVKDIEDNTIDFTIFSPPFSSLYIYSDSLQDMGNCKDDKEFFYHFGFLIPELLRVTRPGRLCAVHCKNLVYYRNQRGTAGLRDFRGEIIKQFTELGWDYHSEITIWKSPETEMQRTKAHGLLHRQLCSDSSFSRQGLPDYLVIFRKWSKSEDDQQIVKPVVGQDERIRFVEYVGIDHPEITQMEDPRHYSIKVWQKYASPVWMDINQMNVLNIVQAKKGKDEKHICPLQLDVIERAIELWTNPEDTVLDPFAGIGSTGHVALKRDRKFVGIELKESYFNQMHKNLEVSSKQISIFDQMEVTE